MDIKPLAIRDTGTGVEYTFAHEGIARAHRRAQVQAGRSVSLLAMDPRGYYVYDLLDGDL